MGRIVTPAFRVEAIRRGGNVVDLYAWDSKVYGRPNGDNLLRFLEKYNESFRPGGINEHVDREYLEARLIRQSTGAVVAEARIGNGSFCACPEHGCHGTCNIRDEAKPGLPSRRSA